MDAVGLDWDFAQFLAPGTRWFLGPLLRSRIPERDIRPAGTAPRFDSSIARPGWRFKTGLEVGRSTYGRAAASLALLEQQVGPETFDRVVRSYAERWAFRHPSTDDFLQVASEVSGKDLRPLGKALFRGTAGLDDSVADLRCAPPRPPSGFFDADGGTPVLGAPRAAGSGDDVRCEVLVERRGELPPPPARAPAPRRAAHRCRRPAAPARRGPRRAVDPDPHRASVSRRTGHPGRGPSRQATGAGHLAGQRRSLAGCHAGSRAHRGRLVPLRCGARRGGRGVAAVSRLLEPVRVGFREWRTVAVLLCANWLVAGLMVAPTGPTVWAAFGHAPLAQGKPVVSSELLVSLRSLFAGGGLPSIAAPLLLLVGLRTFLVGGVV